MEDYKPVSNPIMIARCKLRKNDESPDTNQIEYQSMIGSVLYLTSSRPHIVQVVFMVSCFQYAPKVTHLNVVKRVLRYLKGTKLKFGLEVK